MSMRGLLVLLFLSGFTSQLYSQAPTTTNNTSRDSTVVQNNDGGFFKAFSGNPGKAALYSIILPGTGQFYNRRYWKVPIALAIEGTTIYLLNKNIQEFKKWDEEWKSQISTGTNNPAVTSVYDPEAIKRVRDNARQQKDYTWLALIGAHILISAEAFIDRHLIEFDVSDDLSMEFSPMTPYPGLGITFVF